MHREDTGATAGARSAPEMLTQRDRADPREREANVLRAAPGGETKATKRTQTLTKRAFHDRT